VNLVVDQGGTDHLVFRNGTSYYLLTSIDHAYPGGARLLNVTDPTDVVFIRDITATAEMAKSRDSRIAFLHTHDAMRIYTTDAVVANSAPLFTFTPPESSFILDITSDGRRFYALVNNSGSSSLHVFTPSGDSYTETVAASDLNGWSVSYGAGYVVVPGPLGVAFFAVGDDGLTLVEEEQLSWYNESSERRLPNTVLPVVSGGETALIVSANGVRDVFALEPREPITVSQSFDSAVIDVGGTTHYTLTITNPRAAPVMFDLAHTYPAGLVRAPGSIHARTCGGTLTDGETSFALSNAVLPANATCTVTAILTASTAGTYVNTIPAAAIVSPENTNPEASSAQLAVLAPPGPPPWLSATATSTNAIALTWAPVAGSPTYEIYRNGALLTSTTSTALTDSNVSANTSYIYKVQTVGTSGFSPSDIATTIIFTDASLSGIAAKAIHVAELRTAVAAVRTLAGLGAATFTDAPLVAGTAIKAAHFTELRAGLNEARAFLGVGELTFGPLSTVKATDVIEIRAGAQ
jgi:hypothetical protein